MTDQPPALSLEAIRRVLKQVESGGMPFRDPFKERMVLLKSSFAPRGSMYRLDPKFAMAFPSMEDDLVFPPKAEIVWIVNTADWLNLVASVGESPFASLEIVVLEYLEDQYRKEHHG